MIIVSVNRAMPADVELAGRTRFTAIAKQPADGSVTVGVDGLAGDGVGSPKHHGGPDQAVYAYGLEDYRWWEEHLGRTLDPGTFGENLTIAGLESRELAIGDRLNVEGGLAMEVTAPRIPCGTLAATMDDGRFVERFRTAARPGAYLRVITPGEVAAGATVERDAAVDPELTLIEMFELSYNSGATADQLRRALAAPIAVRARDDYRRRLERIAST